MLRTFVRSRSDARRPADWHDADIILVEVSRCGKTSVVSFLAQRGKKAACVRIGAVKPMPEGFGTADPSKVVLVTRSAGHILRRRKNRASLWSSKSISPTLPHSLDNCATPDEVLLGSGGIPPAGGEPPRVDGPAGLEEEPPWQRLQRRPLRAPRAREGGPAQIQEIRAECHEAMAQRSAEGGTDKCVYRLSDDSGEAAQLLLSRLLVQYAELESPSVVVFAKLDSISKVRSVVEKAQSSQQDMLVLATLRQRSLSDALVEFGDEMGVKTHNAMAGLQRVMTRASSSVATEELVFIGQLIFDGSTDSVRAEGSASGIKKVHAVDSDFFLMAEAAQFAQQHISGVNSREWDDADVLLVGPSRVCKETVACCLA
ncbi:unnamed protein product [Prorocentrum cordatum]|uniref:Uncharacterized protein n=1 Tax=Prorocentrum cordatum TaxID=2364126 RepID=A0ABN9TSL4_9DINO|nr:unnamed protein product [Polarella glacialis]